MLIQTIGDGIVRIPDGLLCGRWDPEEDEACVWCAGDDSGTYLVASGTFKELFKNEDN